MSNFAVDVHYYVYIYDEEIDVVELSCSIRFIKVLKHVDETRN